MGGWNERAENRGRSHRHDGDRAAGNGEHVICPNSRCGYEGPADVRPRMSGCLFLALMCVMILPGLIYLALRHGWDNYCPKCQLYIGRARGGPRSETSPVFLGLLAVVLLGGLAVVMFSGGERPAAPPSRGAPAVAPTAPAPPPATDASAARPSRPRGHR